MCLYNSIDYITIELNVKSEKDSDRDKAPPILNCLQMTERYFVANPKSICVDFADGNL